MGEHPTVSLEYFKWPDRTSTPYKRAGGLELRGEDEHGKWLWSPPGRNAGIDYDAFMTLVPHHDSWTATWIFNGSVRNKIWIDITRPARWHSSTHVTVVDLDIDVQLLPDGLVEVLDLDQFAQRSLSWEYPAVMVADAQAATQRVTRILRERGEPFAAVADRWITMAQSDTDEHPPLAQ